MAVDAAREKMAFDIIVLNLKNICNFTDYFLICHGTSTRQVQAISDSIDEKLSRNDFHCNHIEGKNLGHWILMDYIDFVVHIFMKEHREFYGLERLWGDAKRVPLPPEKLEKGRHEKLEKIKIEKRERAEAEKAERVRIRKVEKTRPARARKGQAAK
ncbi:MAG: ribosome silencing factor [Acidobacteriota bacterium]